MFSSSTVTIENLYLLGVRYTVPNKILPYNSACAIFTAPAGVS
jgi:hypothetical protein